MGDFFVLEYQEQGVLRAFLTGNADIIVWLIIIILFQTKNNTDRVRAQRENTSETKTLKTPEKCAQILLWNGTKLLNSI